MPKVLNSSTNTVTNFSIQYTPAEVIALIAADNGKVAPDFGAGEADAANIKRYSADANGDAQNLWGTDTVGDAMVFVFNMQDEETV